MERRSSLALELSYIHGWLMDIRYILEDLVAPPSGGAAQIDANEIERGLAIIQDVESRCLEDLHIAESVQRRLYVRDEIASVNAKSPAIPLDEPLRGQTYCRRDWMEMSQYDPGDPADQKTLDSIFNRISDDYGASQKASEAFRERFFGE